MSDNHAIDALSARPGADRSGSTNLNSAISGNSSDLVLADVVGQEGVFHDQAEKESHSGKAGVLSR